MAARRDFQGLPKPRPWQQILSFHVRLSTIFNVERLCLVLPAPLVSEFLLFSGWVSSSEWIGRNCQRSNSWGLGCYRKTLWYEALGYSAWELSPSASPAPRLLACAQIAFVVHLGKSAFPRSQPFCSPSLRGRGFACVGAQPLSTWVVDSTTATLGLEVALLTCLSHSTYNGLLLVCTVS